MSYVNCIDNYSLRPFQTQLKRENEVFHQIPLLIEYTMEWWPFTQRMGIQLTSFYVVNVVPRGEGGGEGSSEDRSHWVVKDFCQGKVQFHSIYKHQNQSYHLLPELLSTKLSVCDISYHRVMRMTKPQSNTLQLGPSSMWCCCTLYFPDAVWAVCRCGYSPPVRGPTKSIILPPFCATSVLGME